MGGNFRRGKRLRTCELFVFVLVFVGFLSIPCGHFSIVTVCKEMSIQGWVRCIGSGLAVMPARLSAFKRELMPPSIIMLIALWCDELGMSDWRQNTCKLNHVKRLMRTAQNKKRSKAKSPEQVFKNEVLIVQAHQNYLSVSQGSVCSEPAATRG